MEAHSKKCCEETVFLKEQIKQLEGALEDALKSLIKSEEEARAVEAQKDILFELVRVSITHKS